LRACGSDSGWAGSFVPYPTDSITRCEAAPSRKPHAFATARAPQSCPTSTGRSMPSVSMNSSRPLRDVPLALFPEPCVYRDAAALRPFRVLFESGSMAGCVSAALAGFAVTALARSQLCTGLRACGTDDGLPALPAARFYAFASKPDGACAALIEAVRATGRTRQFAAPG